MKPSIRDVWKDNLEAEFSIIRHLVRQFPIIALDVEFPGLVARSTSKVQIPPNVNPVTPYLLYDTLRCNVDVLNPIQISLSFCNSEGLFPIVEGKPVHAWQFNFAFDLQEEIYNSDSIALLEASGVSFDGLAKRGISVQNFGELLIPSGVILNPDVTLIVFQGGYVMAYLLRIMTGGSSLPSTLELFCDHIKLYLPRFFDLRLLVAKQNPHWKRGALSLLAQEYGVALSGPANMHTAGVDAYLLMQTFWAMNRHNAIAAVLTTTTTLQVWQNCLFGLEPSSSSLLYKSNKPQPPPSSSPPLSPSLGPLAASSSSLSPAPGLTLSASGGGQ